MRPASGATHGRPCSPAYFAPAASYRCQAVRRAARSSRVTLGDLAGLPLLMSAPHSHCEQTRMRGSEAAVTPTWPQAGQVIRVSMSVTIAATGGCKSFKASSTADVHGDARGLPVGVTDDVAGVGLLGRPPPRGSAGAGAAISVG